MRTALPLLFAVTLATPAFAANARQQEAANALQAYAEFIDDFQSAPDKAIPADIFRDCKGIIIMRQFRAGLGVGVKGGSGVVLVKDEKTGAWSPPAFVQSGEGSVGLQVGGSRVEDFYFVMNRDGVDMLLRAKFAVGVDASAAAGPVGRDASASVGPGTAILAYSRAKGLYAGAAFKGGVVIPNRDLNAALYGREISMREILFDGAVPVPSEASALIERLNRYSRASVE